jgi:hypothetical protein
LVAVDNNAPSVVGYVKLIGSAGIFLLVAEEEDALA